MRMVEAIIRPHLFEKVQEALDRVGIRGMTVSEVNGYGRQRGHKAVFRGAEYDVDFVPKLKIEIVVDAGRLEAVVRVLVDAARTGKIGDGKLFVLPVTRSVRVRTGEEGPDSL